MAIPPDVVAGEIITDEWGNDIRDWATAGVAADAASELVGDSSISASWENGATRTLTPHASWVTYKLVAWGGVNFQESGSSNSGLVRVDIGGNQGTAIQAVTIPNGSTVEATANHVRTGLTGVVTVNIQYSGSNVVKQRSHIAYIAIRLT